MDFEDLLTSKFMHHANVLDCGFPTATMAFCRDLLSYSNDQKVIQIRSLSSASTHSLDLDEETK